MRALDDILFGFFIFFAIDRAIRLFSGAVVEPWAESTAKNQRAVDNIKLGTELVLLVAAGVAVYYSQGILRLLNKT
jgi:hypothetical protein